MRLALEQLNPTVGDIAGNEGRIVAAIAAARRSGAQVVVFPELAVCGYPPEDLLLKSHFLADCRDALERIAEHATGIVALVGFPEHGDDVYNSVGVLADGELRGTYRKLRLPNYGVFDEPRHFRPGGVPAMIEVDGVTIGLTICEDDWVPDGPAVDAALAGAELIINISASPYQAGKPAEREAMFRQRARDNLCAYAFCAQVGGQDELVFDGGSLVVDHDGDVVARAPQFCEHQLLAEVDAHGARAARLRDTRPRVGRSGAGQRVERLGRFETGASEADSAAPFGVVAGRPGLVEEVYGALVCGTADYVRKNGFERVVLGLSGGVDSALVAAIAVDALGPERVTAVVMPSPFSSVATQEDARTLARNLGVELQEHPITTVMASFETLLSGVFAGRDRDLTEENLQARIRGTILMALSNKFGWLVLTTGNKSELAVGYSTLYGDSAGGFAVIKDCPKTLVYELMALRATRAGAAEIPPAILSRPPSAELRPDQRDSDSLPDYAVLDAILAGYVEEDLGRAQLVARELPPGEIDAAIRLVDGSEYKRRQNPPGIKVTSKAFGRDRRMPITNRYGG